MVIPGIKQLVWTSCITRIPGEGWWLGGGRGGWFIRILSDGDKFFDFPGFFWVGKSGKYFLGWLDLIRDFFGYSKQSNVRCKDKHSISNLFYCQQGNRAKKRCWLGARIITPRNVGKNSQILRNPLKFAFLTIFGCKTPYLGSDVMVLYLQLVIRNWPLQKIQ